MRCSFKTVLSIAGSDSSAGAGIQADIKAAMNEHVFASTVVTSVTAQSTRGIREKFEINENTILAQLEAVCEDYRPNAVKIGLIPSVKSGRTILTFLKAHLSDVPWVVDPILKSTSGFTLSSDCSEVVRFYKEELLPWAYISTPNLSEALYLLGCANRSDLEDIYSTKCLSRALLKSLNITKVIVTGGHGSTFTVTDSLAWKDKNEIRTISQCFEKLKCKNLHGTGCTYSTILACCLASGYSLEEAFKYTSNKLHMIISDSCQHIFGDADNGCLNIGNFK